MNKGTPIIDMFHVGLYSREVVNAFPALIRTLMPFSWKQLWKDFKLWKIFHIRVCVCRGQGWGLGEMELRVGSNIMIHFLYILLLLIWHMYLYIVHC